ncbi:plasmid pRiA4b ORF-3 family protein [Virgibacillus sp. DJP39]|uniref:plasmid pRiA4b ORF-3 family protein n=1 Tax=Virgibacillus sp. DJP39 TaxID=3409790 RepID=UPI003BB6C730
MLIQCTKKLLTELKVSPMPSEEGVPLFSWHANILTVNRRKTLVLVNDSNRYIIVLHGLKAKDFKKIDELILQAIRETYKEESIRDEVIESYLSQSQVLTFTKTRDKTLVARMNKACDNVYLFGEDLVQHSIYQVFLSKRASRLIVGRGSNDYTRPNEDLYHDLEKLTGGPIFNSEAVTLSVTLELENVHVWRRIVVPKNYTFPDLHRALQIVFGWKDYHLHEFLVLPEQKDNSKPIMNLVCHEEALNYESGIPMELETGVKLLDYLPAEIMYNYDFGDYWEHRIVVENHIDDYEFNYPTCIAGEGNAPPEDVGGDPGYETFLGIISDPANPEYNHTKIWSISQGYEDFDIDMINRRLKYW